MFQKVNKPIAYLVLLLLPFFIYAKDKAINYTDFIGTWTNKDQNTGAIVKFEIINGSHGKPIISLKGSCKPTFCDIGPYKLVFYANSVGSKEAVSAIATYDIGWSEGYYVLKLKPNKEIELSSFAHYDDFRSNSYFSDIFVKS